MQAWQSLTDDELVAWLQRAMAGAHALAGRADMFLAGVSAEWLVRQIRLDGLHVVRLEDLDQGRLPL